LANEGDRGAGRPSVGRVITKSVTSTVNLVVVGSAAVGAAALHSLPVLALGGVAYAALIAWDLATPAFWKKAMAPDRSRFPAPEKLLDGALRDAVKSLTEGRERVAEVLAETPDEVKHHLGGVLSAMTEMEDGAARLVKRADDLTRYLASADPAPIRLEIDKLADKVRRARDDVTRGQYESARQMREEQLRALDDIESARERVMANLTRMVATIEGLPPKIMRMRALDAQAMDALSGSMTDEIDLINGDMKAFEETLQTLGESMKP
jgi:hypothetical protein